MSSERAEVIDLGSLRGRKNIATTVDALLDSAILLLRESPSGDMTLFSVAERAGVSEATAAELFDSVDDVIVDICLRRIREVEVSTDATSGSAARVRSWKIRIPPDRPSREALESLPGR